MTCQEAAAFSSPPIAVTYLKFLNRLYLEWDVLFSPFTMPKIPFLFFYFFFYFLEIWGLYVKMRSRALLINRVPVRQESAVCEQAKNASVNNLHFNMLADVILSL